MAVIKFTVVYEILNVVKLSGKIFSGKEVNIAGTGLIFP